MALRSVASEISGRDARKEPLDLPLPRDVWRRIIRAVNTREDIEIEISFKQGKVVSATVRREIGIED